MVTISALIAVFSAFFAVAQSLRRFPGGPAHISGEEAKAFLEKGSMHVRDASLYQQITIA